MTSPVYICFPEVFRNGSKPVVFKDKGDAETFIRMRNKNPEEPEFILIESEYFE